MLHSHSALLDGKTTSCKPPTSIATGRLLSAPRTPRHQHQDRSTPCPSAAQQPAFSWVVSGGPQPRSRTRMCSASISKPSADEPAPYSLDDTKVLVETAMLAAVSGLVFLLSTLLKLDNSLGYLLPMPIAIAALRSGAAAAWKTMMATSFLLIVLLGPLRAISYIFLHGMLAATLGTLWRYHASWWVSVPLGALVRMAGQLAYLVLSSLTMNENLFAVMLSNVHALLDQISAALGTSGAPSTMAVVSMIFALLLVNGFCYVFLLHVVYRIALVAMGFKMGPLPGIVRKYLYGNGNYEGPV